MTLRLHSTAFKDMTSIPTRYTKDGDDVSPPLAWSGVPEGTKSLALIVDDPDAPDPRHPKTTWVHWVVVDLPASADRLGEGASTSGLPSGAREGKNDFRELGWGGPAPPVGRHRYVCKLYALDTDLPDLEHPTKQELVRAMEGHILESTQLVGTYARD